MKIRHVPRFLLLWAFALGSGSARGQEPTTVRDAPERLRAILRSTSPGDALTIVLRSGAVFRGWLAETDDDSFGLWVVPDEDTRRRLGLSEGRVKRTLRYIEVESIGGAEGISKSGLSMPVTKAEDLASRLRLGDTVYVRTFGGFDIKGDVDDFDGDTLRIDERVMSLSGARGERIEQIDRRVDDSLKNGVLIGAAIGGVLGLVSCAGSDCGNGFTVMAAAVNAAVGAGLGALFDVLRHGREPLYAAPISSTPSELRVGPILTPDRAGLFLSWSF